MHSKLRRFPVFFFGSLLAGSPAENDFQLPPPVLAHATRNGNLVVIELKVSADPHLPLQALDYWMRVR
ncbi:hypothetical protein MYX77_14205, partial [Acidobacteriia bacterium AH_259_A11_L15]|nr:hypothetical protein [Acidobacteriia bacterium AH_259_A11_L15]